MNKQLLLSILVVLFYTCLKVTAQCPTATVPDTVCAGEPFDITNTTPGFDSYYWDFCTGDLNNAPIGSNIGNPGNLLTAPHQIHIVEDSGNFYGFVANFSSNNILRLDYGSSLSNIPLIVSMGTFTSLNGPTGLQIYKENNEWYALVSNYFTSNFVLVSFGSSFINPIITESPLNNIGFNNPFHLKLMKNNSLLLFVVNGSGSNVTKLDFGSSILNTPVSTNLNGPFASPLGIDIAYDCAADKFIGIVANLGSQNLTVLDFGNDLNSNPVSSQITGLPVQDLSAVQIVNDGNNWFVLATEQTTGDFLVLNFGSNLLNPSPVVIFDGPIGGLSTPRGIHFINENSAWYGTIINWGNSLTQINFPDTCDAIPHFADVINPQGILYDSSGNKTVFLKATDLEGNYFYLSEDITISESPVSNFFYNSATCDNTFLFLDSSFFASGSITSWSWDFGDGNTSNTQNPTHSYSMPGNYIVKLTVTGSNGCSSTIEKNILNEKPTASFSVIDGCILLPMEFINTSPDSQNLITSFFWDFGDGNTSNLENPLHSYANQGTYNVTFIVSIGTCSDTVTLNVTYLPKPDVQFSVTNTCLNQQQEFINLTTIATGTITSFYWNFDDGNTSNQTSPIYQFSDTGTYNVELIATGSNGCIDTLTKEVRVTFQPNASFNYSPSILCENNLIFFQDASTIAGDTINSWFWSFGNGDTAFIQNPVYNYNNSGQYNITLTVTAGTSCIDTINQTIIIESSPIVSFSANTVCAGDSTVFVDLTTVQGGAVTSWDWDFGTGDSSNVQNPVFLFPGSGNFPVSLTVTSDIGCVASDTMLVTVAALPLVSFIFTNACSDKLTQFFDSTTISQSIIISWLWNFGDTSSGTNNTSIIQHPVHAYNAPGSYQVSLEVESDIGCKSSLTQVVEISKTPYANFSSSQACDGEHVEFTYIDNSLPSNATNWYWNFGNGATSQIQDPATLYLTWGSYNVTLTVADSLSGCSDTVTKPVEVDPLPVAVIPNQTLCVDVPSAVIDSSYILAGSIVDFEWFINSNTYNIQNPIVMFNDTGSHLVTLIVFSDKGCKDSTSQIINVSSLPIADFTFLPTYGNAPLNVSFVNISDNANSYEWLFGDGQTSNSTSPNHVYSDTGSYNIVLIAINENNCQDSIVKTIYVIQPRLDLAIMQLFPVISDNYISLSVEIFNFGTREVNSFTISARMGGSAAIQEFWSGSLKSGENMMYTFSASIEITDNSNFVCSTISQPNGEVDNNPINNEKCISFIEDLEILSIFPNPATDVFTINFNLSESTSIKIEILDSKGALVTELFNGSGQKGFNSMSFSASFENIVNGAYLIKLSSNQKSSVSKLTKK